MAVKIKLKRMGKIRTPHYRIIVADSRTRRDGRAIEEIGLYNPKLEPSLIKVDSERVQYWLGVGAQPTEPVMVILKVTGDWQKFKGLPGAEGTLKEADAKADKRAAFDAALAEVHGEPKDKTTATKTKSTKKSATKKTAAKKTTKKAEAPAAEATEAEAGAAAESADEGTEKTAAKKTTVKKTAAKKTTAKKTTAKKAAAKADDAKADDAAASGNEA